MMRSLAENRENRTATSADFVDAMRHAASGVTIVTTDGPGGRKGATVSAMCSVAADPPSLLVCIDASGRTARAIARNGTFCVNVLAESQDGIAEAFAGRNRRMGEDPFDHGAWRQSKARSPVLIGSTAVFECNLAQSHEHGSHRIFIGDVSGVTAGAVLPLIYTNRTFCRTIPLGRGA